MQQIHDAAIAHLREFFREMRQWQIQCKKQLDQERKGEISHEASTVKLLQDLRAIYDRYCEYRDFPNNITFAYKPTYDPDHLNVEDIADVENGVSVVINRATTIPRRRIKYTLVKRDAGFKVRDEVQLFEDTQNKWVIWDLLL